MNQEFSKEQFTTLTIIHSMLMFGVFSFMLVVYFLLLDPEAGVDKESYNLFMIVVLLLGGGVYFVGRIVSKKMLSDAKERNGKVSFQTYQSSVIVQAATLEGVALMAVVFSMLSNSQDFLLIAFVLIAVMFLTRPTKEKIKEALS